MLFVAPGAPSGGAAIHCGTPVPHCPTNFVQTEPWVTLPTADAGAGYIVMVRHTLKIASGAPHRDSAPRGGGGLIAARASIRAAARRSTPRPRRYHYNPYLLL